MAGFLGAVATTSVVALAERTTTRTTTELSATTPKKAVDFRVEFNCQQGRHYAKMMRGRGSNRRKKSGKQGKNNYEYLGIASVVAQERGGFYAQRWLEYSFNHTCNYAS